MLKKVLKEKRGNGYVVFLMILAVVAIIGYNVLPPLADTITQKGTEASTTIENLDVAP
ncbi:hypothetical protein [Senegalia massiliensis]|uniref:hypothetical protein n=1 Tax=Senegalia massiliensis TaxID=1720316 RepID=UPI0013642090|nr:hypothetical protein [Senegalia massiliensis]